MFSDMGVSRALIQKQDISEVHLSTAFWLNILVGLILTVFFIAISPLIAKFYNKPNLVPILIVISLNFLTLSPKTGQFTS